MTSRLFWLDYSCVQYIDLDTVMYNCRYTVSISTLVPEQGDGDQGCVRQGVPEEVGLRGGQEEADDTQGVRSERVHPEVLTAAQHLSFQTAAHTNRENTQTNIDTTAL